MKKKILLPTDFSRNAWNAINFAIKLYKNEDCIFYILNAFKPKAHDIESLIQPKPGDKDYDLAKEDSEKGLLKTIKRIKLGELNLRHTYTTMSLLGSPLDAIIEAVEAKDIELVVIGTKGVTAAESIMYGSNAIDVMEEVRNCPVLAIPDDLNYKEPKEIVFPTSFKTHFKRRELQYLYEISKITNASVRILHINEEERLSDKQRENKDLLEDCLDGLDYSFHWLDNIEVNKGLHRFIRNRGSDMIVFINKKHTFFDLFFSKTMVEDLGGSSPVPVLVLHDLRN